LDRLKILTIVGTGPEAIKLAPVIMALDRHPDRFVSRVCATAQHWEMLDQALSPFGIEPHNHLDIIDPSQSLAQVTARAVEGLDPVIAEERGARKLKGPVQVGPRVTPLRGATPPFALLVRRNGRVPATLGAA
jgi:hypothetical protein